MQTTRLGNEGLFPRILLLAAAGLMSWAASPALTLAGDCHHCWADSGDGYLGLAAQACGSSLLTCGPGVCENVWDIHAHVWDGYCGGPCPPCSCRPVLCCKGRGRLEALLPRRCGPGASGSLSATAASADQPPMAPAPDGEGSTVPGCNSCTAQSGQPRGPSIADERPPPLAPMPTAPLISPRPVSAPATTAAGPNGSM